MTDRQTKKPSTTEQGDRFRDKIADLLRMLPGVSNVQTEKQVGSQPVDIYFEINSLTGTQRVGCEAKDYGKPLTKGYITREIYPRYNPLVQEKLIDVIQVVASLNIGATAQEYCNEAGIVFKTFSKLEDELINFGTYLKALETRFASEGLSEYYINPVLGDQTDLEEHLLDWVASTEDMIPIAILAGYGMGKTSLATRLASTLAKDRTRNNSGRIPILIPLGHLASQQDLEGLISRIFVAEHNGVANFHFDLFMKLNEQGKFVIILDGFDEMKHLMTWADLKHNIGQLNRLHCRKSKVLLLGRPSALSSEDERLFVLKGVRRVDGGRKLTMHDAREYREIKLLPFSDSQTAAFMKRYVSFRIEHNPTFSEIDRANALTRIDELLSRDEGRELAGRPVQARMLADLSIEPSVEWKPFTRFELYREFIWQIAERESRKAVRRDINAETRIEFIREIAWWLSKKGALSFSLSEIPVRLWKKIGVSTEEGVIRDLVSGSLLEKKTEDKYYFPHRSFLEFLVADYVARNPWGNEDIATVDSMLSAEVISFIQEAGMHRNIAKWENAVLDPHVEPAWSMLKLIAWAMNKSHPIKDLEELTWDSARATFINGLRMQAAGMKTEDIAKFLGSVIATTANDESVIVAALITILELAHDIPDSLRLRDKIVGIAAAKILVLAHSELHRVADLPNRRRHSEVAIYGPWAIAVTQAFSCKKSPRGKPVIAVDSFHLAASLANELSFAQSANFDHYVHFPYVESYYSYLSLAVIDPALKKQKLGSDIERFFERQPQPSNLSSVLYRQKRI